MTSLQTTHTPAIHLPEEDRATFVMRVYQHVLAAIGAFVAIEALFFATGLAERMYDFLWSGGGGVRWLLFLGLFMAGNWFMTNAATDFANPARAYTGLFGAAAMQALIFAPFLFYVYRVQDAGSTVLAAAAITGIGTAILSVIAFTTRKDLSVLRPLVMWGMGGAMLLIVGALLFGFNLGVWFSVAMIVLAGAAILFQTQNIIRNFPAQAYVAAAVQLFGSIMTMFWYVLRLLVARD